MTTITEDKKEMTETSFDEDTQSSFSAVKGAAAGHVQQQQQQPKRVLNAKMGEKALLDSFNLGVAGPNVEFSSPIPGNIKMLLIGLGF